MNILSQFSCFGENFQKQICQNLPQLPTILKGCLRFHTNIFWISPNLATYTYALLPLEQHHEIQRKKPLSSSHQSLAQQGFKKQTNKQKNCVGTNVEIHWRE